MRKLVSFILAAVLLFSTSGVLAEGFDFSGYSFQELLKIRDELDAAMVKSIPVAISEGNIYNDTYLFTTNGSEVMLKKYAGKDEDLFIPDEINGMPVTIIGAELFANRGSIRTLRLPKNLKSIGKKAFFWWNNNRSNYTHQELVIVLPETLESVEYDAFTETCAKCLIIQSNIQFNDTQSVARQLYIKEGCNVKFSSFSKFNNYMRLLVLPASQTSIPDGIFENCVNLIVVCPAGSYAEEYCKRNFLMCDTEAYEKYVADLDAMIQ